MSITSYSTDFKVKHSFFGKASMASFEPVAELCHTVAKDRNYTEDEEVQLLEIVHAVPNRFLERYPKTKARIVRIQLSVGSSLKSLRFLVEGYAPLGASLGGLFTPTGDIIIAETELFNQEFNQYRKTEAVEDK